MWKIGATWALVLLVAIGAVSLDRPSPRADFVAINNGDVSTLDLTQMSWVQDFRAARLLYEGLTRSDVFAESYPTRPAAAESWEISADRRTYTFRLRRDAAWSNGDPLRAQDFRYAWMRMLLPDSAADYAKLFRLIEGGEAFWKRRSEALKQFVQVHKNEDQRREATDLLWKQTLADFDATVAIRALDEHTLEVRLVKPVAYFLSLTSFPPFFPVHEATVRKFERLDPLTGRLNTDSGWCKPPAIVTNGPFMLTLWQFKREMRFERNPHYWNAADIAINSISMPTIDDGNAAVLAFHTGGVDWVSDVVPGYRAEMLAAKREFYREHQSEYDRLAAAAVDPLDIDRGLPADPRNTIHAFPAYGTYFYNFNCRPTLTDGRPNPFADARVRRAFSMTIDRQGLVDAVRRCGEPAAHTLIPPGSIHGYTSPKGLGFDPAAAKQLLSDAGYADPSTLGSIELIFNKDGGHDLIAQFIAKGWEQHLGVSMVLSQKEVKVFREQVKSGNFMISRGTWFGDYGDPTTFLDINRDGDGNNDRGYASESYEALMEQASDEQDPARRFDLLRRAEKVLVEEDLPLAPIFHFVQIYLFDPHRIRGITPHPRQEQQLHLIDRMDDTRTGTSSRVMTR
jgi:oligopeptide transport system substrate-binding protein